MLGEQGFELGLRRGKGQPCKDVVKPGKRLKAISPGRDYERVQRGAGCGSGRAATEHPVLPAHGKRPDVVFNPVVVRLHHTVVKVDQELWPLAKGVPDGLAEKALGRAGHNPRYPAIP